MHKLSRLYCSCVNCAAFADARIVILCVIRVPGALWEYYYKVDGGHIGLLFSFFQMLLPNI